ncbi:restriction endonuclease subunit S [Aliiglaciecola sp. SL4]|uniref:restriction endonuclease subunit S n=1 Tax=Aliiglaciecola sp. SL4 TaxID=3239806 RepID=UPI00355C809B
MTNHFNTFHLGDVSEIIAGGDKPKNFSLVRTSSKNVPVFANAEKDKGLQGYTDIPRITDPAVTMAARGSNVGFVAIRKEPYFPIVRLLSLIPHGELLDVDYLYYNLKQNRKTGTGSGQPQITIPDISSRTISLPPISLQKKLAKVLSVLDEKIELNNKINAELEAMAKLIYDYWFVQFDFPDANGSPYKSSGGKMVYNQELKREIPEGWLVKELSQLLRFERGISYKSKDIIGTGIPMINLNSFNLNGQYKHKGLKFYSGTYKEHKVVSAGDLVIAITDVTRNADIIGKAFTIPDLFDEDILISCDVAKVIPSELVNSQYLEPLFNSEHYHRYIKHFASGTLVLHLNLDGVNWCKIPVPPVNILNRYKELRTGIDKKLTLTLKENKQLVELRNWLLPMLMNGQVTISNS